MTKQFDDLVSEKVKTLEEGKYKGTISKVERDTSHYDYMRYYIDVTGEDMTLISSYPSRITFLNKDTPSSQHAKFLKRMGLEIKSGKPFKDYLKDLIGKEVSFLVTHKNTENGTYSQIVKESVKLA